MLCLAFSERETNFVALQLLTDDCCTAHSYEAECRCVSVGNHIVWKRAELQQVMRAAVFLSLKIRDIVVECGEVHAAEYNEAVPTSSSSRDEIKSRRWD